MDKFEKLQAENAELKAKLVDQQIGDAFAHSKFVAERLLIPADMLRARFGASFTVENGRVVAVDANKSLIMSREDPTQVAGFDEALEAIVRAYPNRDQIMRAAHSHGAKGGNGASGGTISRDAWNRLPPAQQREALMDQGLKLTD